MDAKTILAAARFRLTQPGHAPYLNAVAWSLNFIETKGIGTVGVDAGLRCYYDPEFVEARTVEQMEAVLVHECHHIVRNHLARLPKGADNMAWNVAGDAEINDDLRKEKWQLPDSAEFQIVFPERLPTPMPEGLTAEEYFASFPHQMQQSGDGEGGLEPHCGGAAGHKEGWENGGPDDVPAVGEMEKDILRRQVAKDVQASQQRGEGAGGLERWADELLNPKVDWRKELAAVVRSSIARMSGPDDFTYRKPNRRRHGMGDIIVPSTVSPIPKVAIVVDTSGSMGQKQLTECLSEVRGVIDAASGKCPVTVLAVDDAVHSVKDVWSVKAVKSLKGGGGTDMGKGIKEASNQHADVCIVLTDGYTPWPPVRPHRMRVIVGILPGCQSDGPPWAKTVHMED